MAQEEEKEEQQTTEAPAEASEDSKASEGGKGSMLGLAIKALIILVLAGGIGFGVGKFINAPGKAQATEGTAQPQAEQDVPSFDASSQNQEYDYYDFEKITSNVDDPRMARYAMVTITLAISTDDYKKELESLIEQEKPRLINWLRTYLAGCTLDDMRGSKNLNRIRREICDRFNELLWPGQRPLIREVLFREFVIQ